MLKVRFHLAASPSYEDCLHNLVQLRIAGFTKLSIQEYWAYPIAQLISSFKHRGFEWVPPSSSGKADILWVLDLPDSSRDFAYCLSDYKATVLQIAESPLKKPFEWAASISSLFSHVLNYSSVSSSPRDIPYRLPFSSYIDKSLPPSFMAWKDRRDICLINTRRRPALRQRLSSAVEWNRAGITRDSWTISHWPEALKAKVSWPPFRLEQIVHYFSGNPYISFDLYGSGWDLRSSRLGFLPSRQPPKCHVPSACSSSILGDKIEILARYRFSLIIENVCGDIGYVSEKLFDSMIAGCIPIYFGDRTFTNQYDGDILFSLSRFASLKELEMFVLSFDYCRWHSMSERCVSFALHSTWSQSTRCSQYVETALSLLDSFD
jgi:hypothetical protein